LATKGWQARSTRTLRKQPPGSLSPRPERISTSKPWAARGAIFCAGGIRPPRSRRGVWRISRNPSTRSEEHTSELHHLGISYALFCLKKKNNPYTFLTHKLAATTHTGRAHHSRPA